MSEKWKRALKWAGLTVAILLLMASGYLWWIDSKGETVKTTTDNSSDTTDRWPNFKLSEFDSPATIAEIANPDVATYKRGTRFYLAGSGDKHMNRTFLDMLQEARTTANIPFSINSGYRTQAYNDTLEDSVPNSSHVIGYAADIKVTSATKLPIAKALAKAGFRRFGFANSYIHVDNDPGKAVAIWNYGGAPKYTFEQLLA